MGHRLGGALKAVREDVLLQHQKDKVVQTPQQEVPTGAMPKAGQRPDDEQIDNVADVADSVAAQGNVYIVPEKAAQGDVPSAPKVGD